MPKQCLDLLGQRFTFSVKLAPVGISQPLSKSVPQSKDKAPKILKAMQVSRVYNHPASLYRPEADLGLGPRITAQPLGLADFPQFVHAH
jgi:hypothetical protein